jgi:hypothetical protein
MASAYNAYATDYTCIDQTAQTLGSSNSLVGANLYLSEAEGGAYIIPGSRTVLSYIFFLLMAVANRVHGELRN